MKPFDSLALDIWILLFHDIPLVSIPCHPVDSGLLVVDHIGVMLLDNSIDLVVSQNAGGFGAFACLSTTSRVLGLIEGTSGLRARAILQREGAPIESKTKHDLSRVNVISPKEIQTFLYF